MAVDLEVFGFDNEKIKSGTFEKYKGIKNEIHRAAIVYSDPKALVTGAKIHFKDRYFFCKKGKCCEVCGPAKYRIGAVLIKYATDKQGNPKKPFEYALFPWIFGEKTYSKLKNVDSEFPLTTHDIKISCGENEAYQDLGITPCNESIWTSREELKKAVLEEAKPIWEFVKRSIAQDLSIEDINDLLGVAQPVGADPSTVLNLDDVLDLDKI